MLQSASNWTLVRGEVLLKKLYVTLAWGGLSYSLGALVIRVFVWKNTGKCSAICSELWFSEMLCISLNAESSSCMVLEEGAPKRRKDMTRASRICLSCIVLEPDSYHCTPTWWLRLPTQLQQEWTSPVGKIRLTILFPMLTYCGS